MTSSDYHVGIGDGFLLLLDTFVIGHHIDALSNIHIRMISYAIIIVV